MGDTHTTTGAGSGTRLEILEFRSGHAALADPRPRSELVDTNHDWFEAFPAESVFLEPPRTFLEHVPGAGRPSFAAPQPLYRQERDWLLLGGIGIVGALTLLNTVLALLP